MTNNQRRAAKWLAKVRAAIALIESGYQPPMCYIERSELLATLRANEQGYSVSRLDAGGSEAPTS